MSTRLRRTGLEPPARRLSPGPVAGAEAEYRTAGQVGLAGQCRGGEHGVQRVVGGLLTDEGAGGEQAEP
ncbi:hypothetical protein [Streptomyces collinus]|uniref:hypothetical protein n=1 Tax=Streptomyces collinus TaxID=42684 RepID=UPI0036A4ED58